MSPPRIPSSNTDAERVATTVERVVAGSADESGAFLAGDEDRFGVAPSSDPKVVGDESGALRPRTLPSPADPTLLYPAIVASAPSS